MTSLGLETSDGLAFAEAQARMLLDRVSHLDRDTQAAAIRSRLDLFAARMLRVRPKEGGATWPFLLNPIQLDYLRGLRARYRVIAGVDTFRGIRDLIVKPRQLGFSTEVAALYFTDGFLNPGRITVVLTHDQKISEELLLTYRTFWDRMPGQLRAGLVLESDSKYSLAIAFPPDGNGQKPQSSRFLIATEAGHDWRGGVIHNLHASEAAFYADYQKFKNSYLQAVPEGGNAVLETTANGQNLYYGDVMATLAREGDPSWPWRLVFYEWFKHPEYRREWHADREAPLTREESDLMGQHGLDLRQIAWRRAKIAEIGEAFPQEYPESLAGAFLTTGRPFFDQMAVARGLAFAKTRQPLRHDPSGLTIWDEPEAGGVYLICSDTSEGRDSGPSNPFDPEVGGSDFSNAYVLEAKSLRVVAAIHGRIAPPEFARQIDRLGRRYRAVAAVERNNHGHTVLHALEQMFYPAIYRHLEYDELSNRRYLVPGFPTTTKTRPQFLDALADAIRQGALLCPDPRFWGEAHQFHRNAMGKPEAMQGAHDDRVISLAIGVYLCTLGRSAWGLEGTTAADGWGFALPGPLAGPDGLAVAAQAPAAPLQATPGPLTPAPAGPVIPLAPGEHPDRAFTSDTPGGRNLFVEVAEERDKITRPTCGNCLHFAEGRCAVHRFQVRAEDPGCPTHYPADAGAWDDPFSGGADGW